MIKLMKTSWLYWDVSTYHMQSVSVKVFPEMVDRAWKSISKEDSVIL